MHLQRDRPLKNWRPESIMNEALKTKHSHEIMLIKCFSIVWPCFVSEMNDAFSQFFKSLDFLVLFYQEKRTQKKLYSTEKGFNTDNNSLKYSKLYMIFSSLKTVEFVCTK